MLSRPPLNLRSSLGLVLLLVAGFLGNYFQITLFLGVDVLFGSIAVLLVLFYYGLAWGVLAALVASSSTYGLWGHPYAMVIFTCEAAFVGLFLRGGCQNLLILDGCYWLLVGMPLGWLFYHIVLPMDVTTTVLIMLKQGVNGIFNALLATMAINFLPLLKLLGREEERRSVSLRENLFCLMVALVLTPSIITLIMTSRREMARLEHQSLAQLQHLSAHIVFNLQSWCQEHVEAMETLAKLAGAAGMTASPALQHDTRIIKEAFPDFLTICVADAAGTAIGIYPPGHDPSKYSLGQNPGDHPYSRQVCTIRRPFRDEVFQGPGEGSSSVAVISVPVMENKRFLGHVSGAVDLHRLRQLLENYRDDNGTRITLTDAKNQVIVSTFPNRPPLQKVDLRKTGEVVPLNALAYQWLPAAGRLPQLTRWQNSYYVQETSVGEHILWRLIVEVPLAPQQQRLFALYVNNLAVMVLLSGIVLILGVFLSRWLTRPLASLAAVTHHLPDKVLHHQKLAWPRSGVAEVESLISNSQSMARALEDTFDNLLERRAALERANDELKTENQERRRAEDSLRRSEERFRLLYEKAPLGYQSIDATGRITEINQTWLEIMGYDREEVIGEWFGNFLAPEEIAGFQKKFFTFVKMGEITDVECELLKKDGTSLVALINGKIAFRGQNGGLQAHCVFSDITARKQAEQEKAALEAKLQQMQKIEAVGTLAGGIAHDFNNILTAILGNAEMLLLSLDGSLASGKIKDALREVLIAGERAKDLVHQILTFSRQADQERQPVEVRLLVAETLKLLRASLPTTIEIRQTMADDHSTVLADPGQIQRVVMNLGTNAYQAMRQQGGVLEVGGGAVEVSPAQAEGQPGLSPGPYVKLIIQDTGRGMTPEVMARVFEPYFTTRSQGEGTGLGLSVAYGIVSGLGGMITVESEPGQGTTFQIYLPRIDRPAAAQVTETSPAPRGTERILFVDDEQSIADIGKRLLEHLGYRVTAITDSAAALAAFREQPEKFDLIITDMTMPKMTGVQLAREIWQSRPDLPIILCTGYSEAIAPDEAKSHGFRGYLPKPFRRAELALTVRAALGKQ